MKNKPEYANLRIAHGKDRCANPPRSGPQGASGTRRSGSGNGPNSAEPLSANGDGDDGEMVSEAIFLGGDEEEAAEVAEAVIVAGSGPDAQDMHVDAAEAAPAVLA